MIQAIALLILASAQRGSPVVLTFHDIIERRDSKALWFDCTTAELRSQISYLKRHGAHFITLSQLYGHMKSGQALLRHAVAITFADNYEGFWLRGYPVLKAEGVPVAMFVHTGYVGDRAHGRPKMDWTQLKALDREGLVTIGSQTVSHPADLGKLSKEQQWGELAESKRVLESQLNHRISYLAYPNGKFSPLSEALAEKVGYLMAFSEVTRPADLSPNLFAVNRYVHTKYRKAFSDGE